MTTKITTDLKIKYLQQLELECGIANGQLFEGVDVAEIRSGILMDILQVQKPVKEICKSSAIKRSDIEPQPEDVLYSLFKNFKITKLY